MRQDPSRDAPADDRRQPGRIGFLLSGGVGEQTRLAVFDRDRRSQECRGLVCHGEEVVGLRAGRQSRQPRVTIEHPADQHHQVSPRNLRLTCEQGDASQPGLLPYRLVARARLPQHDAAGARGGCLVDKVARGRLGDPRADDQLAALDIGANAEVEDRDVVHRIVEGWAVHEGEHPGAEQLDDRVETGQEPVLWCAQQGGQVLVRFGVPGHQAALRGYPGIDVINSTAINIRCTWFDENLESRPRCAPTGGARRPARARSPAVRSA